MPIGGPAIALIPALQSSLSAGKPSRPRPFCDAVACYDERLTPWLRTELTTCLFQPLGAEAERRAGQRAERKSKVQPSQRNRKKSRPRKKPGERYHNERNHKTTYRRAIATACVKAQIPSWHPHQLRHSAATRLWREFGLDVARDVLGHSSPVVNEVYSELDQAKASEAVERVG